MKKLLTFLAIQISFFGYSQIFIENSYQHTPYSSRIRLVKLSSAGYKYVTHNKDSLNLYNLNHTHYLTINIPVLNPPPNVSMSISIYYVSDELFNTNPSDIEYLLVYNDASIISHCRVFDELGNILFSKDTANCSPGITGGESNFISYSSSGTKMFLWNNLTNKTFVCSLPGTLPCQDCTNGNNLDSEKLSNYPNPTEGQTTIEYELPKGTTSADIVFYNMTGQEVKRFKITNEFNDIIINTTDLESGTYYYQLLTADGFKAGKKMVVIK